VITPQLLPLAKASQLPFASSLCGACREVCPVKIDIPALLLHLRHEVLEGGPGRAPARPRRLQALAFALWAFAMRGPKRYAAATFLARTAQRLFGPIADRLPPASAWRRGRDVPRLARVPFRSLWREDRR
jgi:L-lactate dehydrogenase complex protein LldF